MIGSTLSHYRILELLGEGGMGVVYKAQDTVLERLVALKVMRADWLADPSSRQRFLQEARSAAALHHPNIATIFETNEVDGVLYIAMEYIDGQPLRARMLEQPPVEESVRIAIAIADGLCHAHEHGVVHRDLKPENVLLTADGRAKILDFGLAKIRREQTTPDGASMFGQTQTSAAGLTRHGQIMGTPAYMSPEQARGLDVDFRSDVFAFGAVFYEMIAGEPPFRGATSIDTLSAVLHAEPPSLVARNRRLPAAFDQIARRCLQKEPQNRYARTRELLDDLRALDTRPAAAGTVALRRARGAFGGRGVAFAIATVAVLAVGAGVWAWKPWQRSASQTANAGAAGEGGDGAPSAAAPNWILICDFEGNVGKDIAIATRELVSASLSQSRIVTPLTRGQVQRGLTLAGRPDSTRVSGEAARELAVRATASAYVEGRVDKILTGYSIVLKAMAAETGTPIYTLNGVAKDDAAVIGTMDSLGLELRQRLGEEARAVKRTQPLRETFTSSFDAYRSYVSAMEMQGRGNYPSSNALLRQSLRLDPTFAAAYIHLGTNYYNLGYADSSRAAFAIAERNAQKFTDAERLHWQFFVAYTVEYDLAAALSISDLQIQQPQVGAVAYNNRAAVLFDLGRYEDALAEFERGMQVSPFGASNSVRWNQLQILLQLGQMDRAREQELEMTGQLKTLAALAHAVATDQWARADTLSRALQSSEIAPQRRYQARLVQASLLATRGSIEAATKAFAAARAEAPNAFWADLTQVAWLHLLTMAEEPIPPGPVSASADSTATCIVAGLAAAMAGDNARAEGHLAAFNRRPAADRRRYEIDARTLEGWILSISGRDAEIDAVLAPVAREGRGPWICGRIPIRWLLAVHHERAGRLEAAAAAYESVLSPERLHQDVWTWRAAALPFAHRRLASIYARMGRGDDARRHLQVLESAWSRPDPIATRLLTATRTEVAAGPPQ